MNSKDEDELVKKLQEENNELRKDMKKLKIIYFNTRK